MVTERPTSLPGSTSARPGLGRLLNSHASLLLCHGCQLVSAAKGPATAQCKPSECAFAQAALNSSCIALAALPPSWTVQLMTAVMLVQGHSIDDALHCIHISNHPAQSWACPASIQWRHKVRAENSQPSAVLRVPLARAQGLPASFSTSGSFLELPPWRLHLRHDPSNCFRTRHWESSRPALAQQDLCPSCLSRLLLCPCTWSCFDFWVSLQRFSWNTSNMTQEKLCLQILFIFWGYPYVPGWFETWKALCTLLVRQGSRLRINHMTGDTV